MLRLAALAAPLAAAALLAGGAAAAPEPRARLQDAPPHLAPPAAVARQQPAVAWRRSRSLGLPWSGSLRDGVLLPAEGPTWFTWDLATHRAPNPAWRRWAGDGLVRVLLRVLDDFAAAHPGAPRIGIADLSRPRGGPFGAEFGGLGHASHQNGLDVDVLYPRRDRREAEPTHRRQIDRRLAQDLVARFVRAGAEYVFVGPRTGLRGDPAVVRRLAHHDDHLHVRLPGPGVPLEIGVSERGRRLAAIRVGDPAAHTRLLVVGCVHGDECAGTRVTRMLSRTRPGFDLWLVPTLNPDGRALGRRSNARGVDLNRNWPSGWRRGARGAEYGGPRPFSEREARAARDLLRRLRPDVTIWLHQPQALVRARGLGAAPARRYARLAGLPFRALERPPGTAPGWQERVGQAAFVVELPPGPLSELDARRHANAVLHLPG